MRATKRTVIIRSVWAVLFLLIAVAPYIAVKLGSQDAAFFSAFVTPLFLLGSEIAGIRAIVAGSRVTETGKRRVLVWSLIFFASALAALLIVLGSFLLSATPYCTNRLTARTCAQILGFPAYFSMSAFAAASILAIVVAPILALSDAARTRRWLWFALVLLVLLGALAALGTTLAFSGANVLKGITSITSMTSLPAISSIATWDWLLILRVAAPLLLPFVALLYSLSGRERSKAPKGGSKQVSDVGEESLAFTLRSPGSQPR